MIKILTIGMLLSIFTEAYDIKNTHWADSGSTRHKVYSIQCSNGNNIIAQYYPSSNTYHSSGGRAHSTLNQAVSSSCGKRNSKTARLKKRSLVCSRQKFIQKALRSEASLSIVRLDASFSEEECLLSNSSSKVTILKHYPKETFMDKDNDGNTIERTRIDSYEKISDGRKNYYVRSSAL